MLAQWKVLVDHFIYMMHISVLVQLTLTDLKIKYCLMLLKLLLALRSKNSILHEWQVFKLFLEIFQFIVCFALYDTENFDQELAKLPSFPAIVVLNSDDSSSILVVVEQKLLCRCNDMVTAVVALIATYFSFDMSSFPSGLYAILIFIQHFMPAAIKG